MTSTRLEMCIFGPKYHSRAGLKGTTLLKSSYAKLLKDILGKTEYKSMNFFLYVEIFQNVGV